MIIPSSSSSDISPASALVIRAITSDIVSTADSFKSWDTCMANKTCKITAIVLICVAGFIVLWLLMAIVSCCCMGMKIMEGCCFCFTCCCRGSSGPKYVQQQPVYVEKPSVYNNPNMYGRTAQPQFQQPPTPAHFANQHQYEGYQPVNNGSHHEDPFTDHETNSYYRQ